MTPWFNTEERVDALDREALSWIGTPFFPNSAMRGPGGGVSCQKLAAEVYRGVGFWRDEVPGVRMNHAQFSLRSLIKEFMAGRKEFARLEAGEALLPGDLISMRVGKIDHHLGIVLLNGQFINALKGRGVCRSDLQDPTFVVIGKWRPIEV